MPMGGPDRTQPGPYGYYNLSQMASTSNRAPPPGARFIGWAGFGGIPAVPPTSMLQNENPLPQGMWTVEDPPPTTSRRIDEDALEMLPEDGSSNNPFVIDEDEEGHDNGPDEEDNEILFLGFHRPEIRHDEEPTLQVVNPDPQDLREVWSGLFGQTKIEKKEKKEERAVPLDTSSSGGSSIGRSCLLSPTPGEVPVEWPMQPEDNEEDKYLQEEMETEGCGEYPPDQGEAPPQPEPEAPNLEDLIRGLREIHGEVNPGQPTSPNIEEEPDPLFEDQPVAPPSIWMEQLISAAPEPQPQPGPDTPRYCLKCQYHGVLRPTGDCQRRLWTGGPISCPRRECPCHDCRKVEGQRSCGRDAYRKRKDKKH